MRATTNRKPKGRAVSEFPKPSQTNMLGVGGGGDTIGLQHQTLKTLRTKYGSKKSCCFRSPDGGALRLGGRWPHVSPVWSGVSAICDSSQASIHWMFQSLNAWFVS